MKPSSSLNSDILTALFRNYIYYIYTPQVSPGPPMVLAQRPVESETALLFTKSSRKRFSFPLVLPRTRQIQLQLVLYHAGVIPKGLVKLSERRRQGNSRRIGLFSLGILPRRQFLILTQIFSLPRDLLDHTRPVILTEARSDTTRSNAFSLFARALSRSKRPLRFRRLAVSTVRISLSAYSCWCCTGHRIDRDRLF